MDRILAFADRSFLCLILFLLGAKTLDKNHMLSVGQMISYGEILFLLYFFIAILKMLRSDSASWLFVSQHHKRFTLYLTMFALWTGLSWSVNTVTMGGDLNDLFGMTARILFYGFMSVFVAIWVEKYGPALVAVPFCLGVLAIFFYNFSTAALAMSIIGVPQALPENNFSGVMLPISALYLALVGMASPGIIPLLLMCVCYASTVLVYSLGAYLFLILGFPAVALSIHAFFVEKKVAKVKRALAFAVLFFAVAAAAVKLGSAYETVRVRIGNKFANIPLTEKAKGRVQSGDIRRGFFLSSLVITRNNPLFGVGEYNWREANLKNKDWLGEVFYEHKNPHNAFAQILSMFGIPAFVLFVLCLYAAFRRLYAERLRGGAAWGIFVLSSSLVFLATGNVMDSIFTTTYFYFYAALIFGIGRWRRREKHEATYA